MKGHQFKTITKAIFLKPSIFFDQNYYETMSEHQHTPSSMVNPKNFIFQAQAQAQAQVLKSITADRTSIVLFSCHLEILLKIVKANNSCHQSTWTLYRICDSPDHGKFQVRTMQIVGVL